MEPARETLGFIQTFSVCSGPTPPPDPPAIRASALDAFLIYPLAEMFFPSLYLLLEKSLLPFKAYFAQKMAL